MRDSIRQSLLQAAQTFQAAAEVLPEVLERTAHTMADVLRQGNKVMFCGNGGSAADSQHLATELVVRLRGEVERAALPGLALTTDTSLLTACANDYSFEDIFERQVRALGRKGDLLVGISTSGNSGNVVKAFHAARELGIFTVLFSGGSGGKLKELADMALLVPEKKGMRMQEVHIAMGHILVESVEDILFKK